MADLLLLLRRSFGVSLLALAMSGPAAAESRYLADFSDEPYRATSDFFQLANPLAALAVTAYQRDGRGAAQLGLNLVASAGTTELLKRATNDTSWGRRPDGREHAFPSGHVSVTCSAAAFLHDRYGWRYGVALYATSAWTAYARVHNDDHHWRDVIAGCALAIGFSKLITTPFERHGVQIEPAVFGPRGTPGLALHARF